MTTIPIDFQIASPADQLKAIESQVKSLGGAISGIGDPKQLLAFGRALQDQTEAMHQYRSGVDDVVEQLNVFGDVGADTVAAINRISDPTKRLAVAHDLLARQTSVTSGVTQRFSDELNATRARLVFAAGGAEKFEQSVEALKGGLTLATGGALALAGAVGGVLTSAVSKFVEEDKKAAAAVKGLTDGFDEFLYTLGNAVVGGDNFANTTDKVTGALEELTKKVDENREGIFDFSKDAVVGLTHVVEWTAKAALGLYGVFQVAVDGLQEAFRQGFLGFLNLAEGLADVLGIKLGDQHYQLKLTVETDTSAFRETERIAELLDGVSSGADKVRAFFGDGGAGGASAPVSSAKRRARSGGGGAGGGRNTESARNRASSLLAGAIAFGDSNSEALFDFQRTDTELPFLIGDARAPFEELAGVVADETSSRGNARRRGRAEQGALKNLGFADGGEFEKQIGRLKTLGGVLDDAKGAATGFGVALSEALAGLASGGLTLDNFGSAIRGAFGSLWADLGRGFVAQGIALGFAGDFAGGAALVAAGIGLQATAGLVSSKGKGGGGVSAPSSTSEVSRSATSLARDLRGGRDTGREEVVVLRVDDQDLRAHMRRKAADDARRGWGVAA